MRERSSEKLGRLLLASVIALLVSSSLFAQGSDGRSEFSISNSTRSKPKIAKASYRKPQQPVPPKPATLLISVNESASSIYITRTDDFSVLPQPPVISIGKAPIVRTLDAGSYQLRIKKNGYFDETRNLDISPGQQRKVNFTMRPQMASLTVKTNLSDAEIEVENAGTFNKPLKRHFVIPGTYRITLRRRGYVTQTVSADLSLAGKEQTVYVVLKPMRIESVLWTANKAIERGELDTAADLVNDVLALNPSHAKANLVRGHIELRLGRETASMYFLRAIDGGEAVLLPMQALHSGQLVNVDVGIDRETILFASENFLEMNFRILRSELDELSRAVDADQTPFLTVRGKSSFYGKPFRPEMQLYSDTDAHEPKCPADTACVDEVDTIYRFFSNWRNRPNQ